MPTINELRQVRIEKLNALRQKGINPYPPFVERQQTIDQAKIMLGKPVIIVGRIMAQRTHGKIVFLDVRDESGSMQIVIKSDTATRESVELIEFLDIGDFVGIKGEVGKTQSGELSVFVTEAQIISKSLRPLPDQWSGFKDIEDRYRQRYLDTLLNPQVKQVLDARWTVEKAVRIFMWEEKYTEVETPVLQPLYGGTNAKPFITHMHALDRDFYLRLAPELYLKRLIVGGYERVFEIARNFRNEGIDLTHQPEFTMMEFYEAYADYKRIMDLTEKLFKFAAYAVNNHYKITIDQHTIDLSGTWVKMTVDEALLKYEGIDWATISDKEIKTLLDKHNFTVHGAFSRNKALFTIYDHLVTPKLIEPTWVYDYPREVSPLSKEHRSKEGRVERFEGYIGGKEICDGWSEITNGLEQRDRFEQEQKNLRAGDLEAHPLDEDFLMALEYGCPPLGGIGIGIDRLVMFLTNTWVIRDVVAFPTLRPQRAIKTVVKSLPKVISASESISPLSKEEAIKLLHAHMQNPNLRRHCYAVGFAMRALAEKLGGDADTWEVLGILHDADWEETKDTPDQHTRKTIEWLKEMGIVDGPIVHALMSHNRKHTELAELDGLMEWALETVDELTGFIVAVALVRPEKKLSFVTVESVLKKWNAKEFARAVDRGQIEQCEEKLGVKLPEFIITVLTAMQVNHDELGL